MKSNIVILDPTIELDIIDVIDNESEIENQYGYHKNSKIYGDYTPFIRINDFDFFGNDIIGFNLSVEGFFPSLTVTVRERFGTFVMKGYPKDGDIISVYLKSSNKDYKSVRNDYRIVSVTGTNLSGDKYDENNTYTLKGILNLPQLFADRIKSFKDMTSLDTLKSICKETGLGLVTNETTFNDSMTRLCPSIPYKDFIIDDITKTAYKNEESFFISFIDQYYYLNLIEINQLIVIDKELDDTIINFIVGDNYSTNGVDENELTMQGKWFLSNSNIIQMTPNHIKGFVPKNKSGIVHLNHGYKTNLLFYDKDKKELKEISVETLETKENTGENFVKLKGRNDSEREKLVKTIFVGYKTENTHDKFLESIFQNEINNVELDKFSLDLKLPTYNPVLHKYQIVPVYITNQESGNRNFRDEWLNSKGQSNEGNTDDNYETPDTSSINKFLSGYYICTGINYRYNGGAIETSCSLTKRDFFAKVPKKDENNIDSNDSNDKSVKEIKKNDNMENNNSQINPNDPIPVINKTLNKSVQDANVKAFLKVIRQAEGTDSSQGYHMLFGGETFQSLNDHPNKIVCKPSRGKKLCSTAAGAYQILYGTWIGVKSRLKLTDFSESSQDLACQQLIAGRGALDDVKNGRFDIAIQKCNKEWASLPGSPYGQPTKPMAYLKQIYTGQGGQFA